MSGQSRNQNRKTRRRTVRRDMLGRFVVSRVEADFGLAFDSLRRPGKRTRAVSEARGRAGYVLHTMCGLSLTQVGICLAQHRSSVAKAVERIEFDRDDPVLDAHLEALEEQVRPLVEALDRALGGDMDGAGQ